VEAHKEWLERLLGTAAGGADDHRQGQRLDPASQALALVKELGHPVLSRC
jgi:hypothetical protein